MLVYGFKIDFMWERKVWEIFSSWNVFKDLYKEVNYGRIFDGVGGLDF